jgi:multidrug efflux pump subunit AcrA (membrane-fusion protein)
MDIARVAPKRRGRTLLLAGGGVALLVTTIVLMGLKPAAPTVERNGILIDSVRRGDVVREVRGQGSLVPEQIRWITAQASARVERLGAESGRTVKAGDILLELSNPDLRIQTMQAEQQVQQAQIALLNLKTTLRSQLLTQEGLVATTRTQFISAQNEGAAADSLVARRLLSTIDAANRRAQAEELTVRMRVEKERLDLMRQSIDSQLAVQASQVQQLRAIADNQQARLRSLEVRAPEGGVLQDLTLQLGQWVPEGTTLAKVVQPGKLKAVIRVPESQAKDVIVGQPALIDTRNGVVKGHVMRKDPSAQGGNVTIDVALDGALPAGAVPDLSVDGTIQVERMANVLYTGRPAGSAGAGTMGLFKLDARGDEAVRIPVSIGRVSVSAIEILDGLAPGDRLIVSDMTPFANAQRVRIR